MTVTLLQAALGALFLPLASAALIGLVPALRRRGTLASLVSLAAAGASLWAAILLLIGATRAAGPLVVSVPWLSAGGKVLAQLGLRIDGTSSAMLAVVALVATLVQLYSIGYLASEPEADRGRYFTFQSLFLFSMQALVLSPNLVQLFCAWELVGACSYLLIGYYWPKPSAGKAAVKAFWVNKLGDMGFLLALAFLIAWFGTTDVGALAAGLRPLPGVSPAVASAALIAIPLLLFLAVMSKSAQFPLHVWLPDAMEGPTPVSALLHAATMVAAGVYLLVRAFPVFAPLFASDLGNIPLYVGAFTALFAAVVASTQDDIKRVLAWSTCSQLGMMVAGLSAGGLLAGYFHLTTHAFFKALLFLAAGSVIHGSGTNDLRQMGGLSGRMKVTSVLFLIGAVALAGVPPFAGFFSKELILAQLKGEPVALGLCLGTTLLTPFYMARTYFRAFVGAPRSEHAAHAHESGPLMLAPMVVLALLAIVAGFGGGPFAARLGLAYEFHVDALGVVAVGLVLVGLVAGVIAGRRPEPVEVPGYVALIRGGFLDRGYEALYRGGLLVFSRGIGRVDRYIVDGAMNLVGWGGIELGGKLRTMQTGQAQDYVLLVVIAFAAVAAWGVFGG